MSRCPKCEGKPQGDREWCRWVPCTWCDDRGVLADGCQSCGMPQPGTYHPFLYCELYCLGHTDPEGYLREHGFDRSGVGG